MSATQVKRLAKAIAADLFTAGRDNTPVDSLRSYLGEGYMGAWSRENIERRIEKLLADELRDTANGGE
jgi:hypothetical protein